MELKIKNNLSVFVLFAFCLTLLVPFASEARMDYVCGSGMAEGDPGDGDDSIRGGSGGYVPDDVANNTDFVGRIDFLNEPSLVWLNLENIPIVFFEGDFVLLHFMNEKFMAPNWGDR
jgi:hypothetical protein